MNVLKDIFQLNLHVCSDLWNVKNVTISPEIISPKLIFPPTRLNHNKKPEAKSHEEEIRISEQESRVLYCNCLNSNSSPYYYSIETPTRKTYIQTGSTKMSALSDLSIYSFISDTYQKLMNIEFKAHNCEKESIRKDLEKIIKEGIAGNWFHTLKNIDSGTLPSLFEKFASSLKNDDLYSLVSKPETGIYNEISIIFCFCILDKKSAFSKHFSYRSAGKNKRRF